MCLFFKCLLYHACVKKSYHSTPVVKAKNLMEEFLWKVMGILPPVVCRNFCGCFSWKHNNDPRTQSKYLVQLFHCNKENIIQTLDNGGGVVAPWLVPLTLDQAVQV